jgi:multimeric flavodoxin WrbA
MVSTVLVVYYSKKGATEKMALEIARGVKDSGVNVVIKTFMDCTIADLLAADAVAFGSPNYYSNIAWQPKKFLDEVILEFYARGGIRLRVRCVVASRLRAGLMMGGSV